VELPARPLDVAPRSGLGRLRGRRLVGVVVVLVEEGEARRRGRRAGLLEVGEAAGLRAVEAAGQRLRVAPEAEVVGPVHFGGERGSGRSRLGRSPDVMRMGASERRVGLRSSVDVQKSVEEDETKFGRRLMDGEGLARGWWK
jgi:hypothetical protein